MVPHSPALSLQHTPQPVIVIIMDILDKNPPKIFARWKLTLLREGRDRFRGVILERLCSWEDFSVYMNNKKISTTLQALSRHLRWQHPSGFIATQMMKDKIEKVGGDTGERHAHTEEWIRLPRGILYALFSSFWRKLLFALMFPFQFHFGILRKMPHVILT